MGTESGATDISMAGGKGDDTLSRARVLCGFWEGPFVSFRRERNRRLEKGKGRGIEESVCRKTAFAKLSQRSSRISTRRVDSRTWKPLDL